jgi:asparagine synthase (glutamine-hydrolysing)
MCSIFGIIGDLKGAKEAFSTLAHRGRDSYKIIQKENIFFASHRLAIESFTQEQKQPLEDEHFIITFNGEIYNYRFLIRKYSLKSNSEIEVILELFKRGYNLLEVLRGMFAIAIFNKKTKELLLIRDRVGKKPLYYAIKNNNIYFASEPKALYKLVGFHLDKRAIHQFLGYGTMPVSSTLAKGVYKVPPATKLIFKTPTQIETETYENFLEQELKIFSLKSATKVYEKYLKESIALRLPKKVEYGFLVSGGLDSSLVAAIASKLVDNPIDIFSIGYDGYEKYDERVYAKELASFIGANFYEYNFTKSDFFKTLDELLEYIDDPIGDPAQIPLYFLIKQAKKRDKRVLLSGDGSDEFNFGYRVYKEYLMMEQVKELPYANWLKNHLKAHFSLNKEWEWYKRALQKEVIFRSSAELYTDRQLNMLLRLQERDNKNFEVIADYYKKFERSKRDILDWYSYIDLKVLLGEFFLHKIDRVSMANGVEVRSPFLDTKLLELSFSIDPKIRFNPKNVKPILKEIASKYLPVSLIYRKKKGLNYPFIEWILQENGLEIIYQANEEFKLFKTEQLDFLSSKASSGKFKQHLFPLYILSLWLLKKRY